VASARSFDINARTATLSPTNLERALRQAQDEPLDRLWTGLTAVAEQRRAFG
jgi:hypothetical protein